LLNQLHWLLCVLLGKRNKESCTRLRTSSRKGFNWTSYLWSWTRSRETEKHSVRTDWGNTKLPKYWWK